MFVQATKSRKNGKTYTSHLVRESFRTPNGPRSRTICNISKLPPEVRHLISSALSGKATIHADSLEIDSALDFGGLAVLVDAWKSLNLDLLLADIGTPRQRALLKAMVFARLLFPCSKLALKDSAQGTLLAAACGLPADEDFDEDDLYAAMDSLTGNWCALEKKLATETFKEPVSLALYDLTSVYFEGSGPEHLARYGHSRDHRSDRPQIILAVATDTHGTPLHISILRGNRADSTTLRSTIKILRRRFQIQDAVFVFDGGMSSKINLQSLQDEGLEFVTRLSNSTLETLLKDLPGETQLELTDAHRLIEIEHNGKRHVIAGGPWRKERDRERRQLRIAKAEAAQDGWYLLHSNLPIDRAAAAQVQGHYKNLLEVEEAFCELKSSLQVGPVFHRKPERVINHVRICFLAYWISARLARQWRLCGETGEVTRILRQLQTIRLGSLHIKNPSLKVLKRITEVPADLNAQLAKLKLLHLFAAPPAWAENAEPIHP